MIRPIHLHGGQAPAPPPLRIVARCPFPTHDRKSRHAVSSLPTRRRRRARSRVAIRPRASKNASTGAPPSRARNSLADATSARCACLLPKGLSGAALASFAAAFHLRTCAVTSKEAAFRHHHGVLRRTSLRFDLTVLTRSSSRCSCVTPINALCSSLQFGFDFALRARARASVDIERVFVVFVCYTAGFESAAGCVCSRILRARRGELTTGRRTSRSGEPCCGQRRE